MPRDPDIYLADMRRACEKVLRFSYGFDRESFFTDERTADAVLRNLEIVGEAAKHVPPDVQSRFPAVEWRKIAGLRDIVAHGYFALDEDIVWDVVQHKIPELLVALNTPSR